MCNGRRPILKLLGILKCLIKKELENPFFIILSNICDPFVLNVHCEDISLNKIIVEVTVNVYETCFDKPILF